MKENVLVEKGVFMKAEVKAGGEGGCEGGGGG